MSAIVKDVMSTHVIAVRQDAKFKEMAARLHEHRVSAFPVLDRDNKVIGVVSEADLLTKEALEGELSGVFHTVTRHREQANACSAYWRMPAGAPRRWAGRRGGFAPVLRRAALTGP